MNSTQLINYSKDLEIEYNFKLLVIASILVYSVVLMYLAKKWEAAELWEKLLKLLVMQIPSAIFIVFTPLSLFYLFRGVSWEIIFTLLIAYYTYLLVIMVILFPLGLGTYLLNYFGFNTEVSKMEVKR